MSNTLIIMELDMDTDIALIDTVKDMYKKKKENSHKIYFDLALETKSVQDSNDLSKTIFEILKKEKYNTNYLNVVSDGYFYDKNTETYKQRHEITI